MPRALLSAELGFAASSLRGGTGYWISPLLSGWFRIEKTIAVSAEWGSVALLASPDRNNDRSGVGAGNPYLGFYSIRQHGPTVLRVGAGMTISLATLSGGQTEYQHSPTPAVYIVDAEKLENRRNARRSTGARDKNVRISFCRMIASFAKENYDRRKDIQSYGNEAFLLIFSSLNIEYLPISYVGIEVTAHATSYTSAPHYGGVGVVSIYMRVSRSLRSRFRSPTRKQEPQPTPSRLLKSSAPVSS